MGVALGGNRQGPQPRYLADHLARSWRRGHAHLVRAGEPWSCGCASATTATCARQPARLAARASGVGLRCPARQGRARQAAAEVAERGFRPCAGPQVLDTVRRTIRRTMTPSRQPSSRSLPAGNSPTTRPTRCGGGHGGSSPLSRPGEFFRHDGASATPGGPSNSSSGSTRDETLDQLIPAPTE